MVERGPWEAEIPLEALAAAPFPKLVVSGAHHPAFDAICDALERELEAERVVLPGYGHAAQRHPDFNTHLVDFVERASCTLGQASACRRESDADTSPKEENRLQPDPLSPGI